MQGTQTNAGQQTPMADAYAQAQSNATTAQPTQQTQQAHQAPVGGGLRGMMMGRRAPGSKESSGRDLGELTKKLQEFREKSNDPDLAGLDIKIIPLPRGSQITSAFSNSISLVVFMLGLGDKYAYHTLLLSSEMASAPPSRSEQYGYSIEAVTPPRTPTTLADSALADVIKQKVMSVMPQNKVYSADWSVVPLNFKMADPYAIEDLFRNCLRACWQELMSKEEGFTYDSLAASANDTSAIVSIHFNQDQANQPVDKVDAAGLPIRSEILVDFRSEQSRSVAKDMMTENTANVVEFGQVMAMTSLNIDPVAARQNQFYGSQQSGANDTQEYSAEITITGFDIATKVDLSTVLLMISTILPVLDSNSRPWLRNYMPKHLQNNGGSGGNFRPRDLGALNYDYGYREANSSTVEPFGTADQNAFKMENFNYLANLLIQPGAALSIDVPECGATTWFLRAFAECNTVQAAHDAIVKALDGLTDGRFSQFFNQSPSAPMITVPRHERTLLGYFYDEAGVAKDVRIIDMTYLLNHSGHDTPDIGRKWMATYGGSTDAQLAARAKLIEHVASNVVFTGIAAHRTFTAHFLQSMDRAIVATGLKIRNEMGRDDARLMVRHAAGLAQAGALMTNFQSGIFTTGGMGSVAGNGFREMAHTRAY